jgi:hypothetical protein
MIYPFVQMLLHVQDPPKLNGFVVSYGSRSNNCSLGIVNLECSHLAYIFALYVVHAHYGGDFISFFVPMVVMVGS